MGQVVSFRGYTPAARFDGIPWAEARVEEGATSAGPWVLIDTLPLVPLDVDPSTPALRNLTTDEASTTPNLWYRLTFVDGNGDVGEATTPVQNLAAPTLAVTPYVSLEAFKAWAAIKVATDDARIELALAAATAAINHECDRDFHVSTVAEARLFTPRRPLTVEIDDLVTLTELATDLSGFGNFFSWDEANSFTLLPLNAAAKRRPYERIRVRPWAQSRMAVDVELEGSVRVTGVFGWPAIPDDVIECTMLLANRLRQRKDTPFGIASFGNDVALRLLRTDPDMQLLLNDLVRDTVIY